MPNNLEIARAAKMEKIPAIAAKCGIDHELIEPYGHHKAKISLEAYLRRQSQPDGKLILVTAISPTPAGEGKTTTSIGLTDALNRIGKKAIVCLREPALGPVFGMKGGAAGGGYAQVVPMEDINLHFTGDMHAIQIANNLLAALIDNHIHYGNQLGFDVRRITWRRSVDVSDRSLRDVTVGLGGASGGVPRQDGFDIGVASEVMAVLCLSNSLQDLRDRLANIVVGYTRDHRPIRASDLNAQGAMTVVLKEAIKPNLVQTLENNPAIIHGGPFANIAHGCNSVLATRMALKHSEYTVTEAGFGADLGAEKFIDIKCRKSGLRPSLAVVVATVRALKFHGGAKLEDLTKEDLGALERGIPNLERHVENLRQNFGLHCVVAINHFVSDTPKEIALLEQLMKEHETPVVVCRHWAEGSRGAEELARKVVELTELAPVAASAKFLYEDSLPLEEKMRTVARRMYGATDITMDPKAHAQLVRLQELGFGNLPICVAKTQYSFSTDPNLKGAPSGHVIHVREVRLSAGAGFVVMICGEIMTLPGLPKVPAANKIDIDEKGLTVGLF